MLALAGLLPGLEPRYAFPLLAVRLGLLPALAVAAAETLALALALPLVAERAWLLLVRWGGRLGIASRVTARIERAREKARRLVSRYGVPGLAVFVAIPLPVTGIYTGAVVAALLGVPRAKAGVALAAGGMAALLLVALPALGAGHLAG